MTAVISVVLVVCKEGVHTLIGTVCTLVAPLRHDVGGDLPLAPEPALLYLPTRHTPRDRGHDFQPFATCQLLYDIVWYLCMSLHQLPFSLQAGCSRPTMPFFSVTKLNEANKISKTLIVLYVRKDRFVHFLVRMASALAD